MHKKNLFSISLALSLLSSALSAQDTGQNPVYKRGETVLERTLPPSPEAASRVKYADVPFTHCLGAAEYSVEFSTLKGRELQIPIGLHYRSNGIKLDEIAGVAGLGWTLEAGGCITRTVMDMPDEFSSPLMIHRMPSGTPSMGELENIVWHRVDAQLDRYSYDVCGLSGSFVIDDNGHVIHLSGDGSEIAFTPDETGAPGIFIIVGPDGTRYELSEKESGHHDASSGQQPVQPGGEVDRWDATTAWYVTRIISDTGLETAIFSYESAGEWVRDMHPKTWTYWVNILSSTVSESGHYNHGMNRDVGSISHYYDVLRLKSITLGECCVSFDYKGDTGIENHCSGIRNYPERLTGMTLRYQDGIALDSLEVGTRQDSQDGRILLHSLRRYRGGVLDDSWDFSYYRKTVSVCRGSQDWYGYYNSYYEPEFHRFDYVPSTETNVCPFEYEDDDSNLITSRNACVPNSEKASYMSLKKVDHDGVQTEYEYEGNDIRIGSETTSIGLRVRRIVVSALGEVARERCFSYANPILDGPALPVQQMYATVTPPKDINMAISQTWSSTLHETPVVIGPSIRDTRVFYGEVVEETEGSRTRYCFDTTDIRPGEEDTSDCFPSSTATFYCSLKRGSYGFDPWVGYRDYHLGVGPATSPLLVAKEEYRRLDVDDWQLCSTVSYSYGEPFHDDPVMVSYSAVQVNRSTTGLGGLSPSDVYHFPVWAIPVSQSRPLTNLPVNYHPHGNDSTRVDMRYVARTSLSVPSRLASMESTEGGVTRRLEYTYPDTFGEEDGGSSDDEPEPEWARRLTSAHRLSTPVGTDWYVHSAGATPSTPLRSERTEYGTSQIGTRSALLPTLHREYYSGEECWREEIRGRNAWGNVSQVKEKGKPETFVTWGYGGLYPTQITQGTLTTTYTWIPGIGLSSTTSPSGVVTSYEYDHAGRLSAIKDEQDRTLESWEYHLFNDGGDGHLSRCHRTYRSPGAYGEDITWWNTLGLHQQDVAIGGAGDGRDLVSAFGADAMLHDDARVWLPYPAQTGGFFQESAEDEAAAFHGNSLAYTAKTYEKSAREKVLSEALPGYAGTHETQYTEDVCTTPFPKYVWVETTPATAGVQQQGSYAPSEVVVATTTDADGRVRSTYTDHAGRTLGTSVGDDAPTYYIYDTRDQLRAVAGSGIALSDTLSMWRYSYDALGRLASKGIPGSVRERYTYDDEDRIIETCRGAYVTATDYDELNRPTAVRINGALTEEHQYAMDKEVGARLAIIDRSFITPTDELEYVQKSYLYDSRGRLITTTSTYPGGDVLTESTSYNLAGEVTGSSSRYRHGGQTMRLDVSNTLDSRGRLTSSTSSLKRGTIGVLPLSSATTQYSYDAIGRPCGKTVSTPDGETLSVADTLALQGWLVRRRVTRDGLPFFTQDLRHDEPAVSAPGTINIGPSAVPSYTGLVTGRTDTWNYDRFLDYRPEVFYYDYAGRLSEERVMNNATTWTYDQRGNITSATTSTLRSSTTSGYAYDGDRLRNIVTMGSGIKTFSHDQYGRMTRDGLAGTNTVYNCLDRPTSITDGLDTTRFVYLSDGTKLCVLNTEGEGLVYRGAMVYRQTLDSDDEPVLTLESARCPEGRLTPSAPLLFVEDHLGSVRAVIDGSDGSVLESSNYSAYGTRSAHSSTVLPSGLTLRERYTGCEDLVPDFLLPYTDHQARLYSSTLSRWMAPDPLSEKYYGISPYAYCGGNPMGAVDPEGKDTKDVIFGLIIGVLTDAIPGTSQLRDNYTPTDQSDYETGLRTGDNVSLVAGVALFIGGISGIEAGTTLAVAGVATSATGAGAVVGVPVATAGATVDVIGAAAMVEGSIMAANAASNISDGKSDGSVSSNGKNERHGDGGRALSASERRIQELEHQKSGVSKKERNAIDNKIRNLRKYAQKKNKGEEHSRGNKR